MEQSLEMAIARTADRLPIAEVTEIRGSKILVRVTAGGGGVLNRKGHEDLRVGSVFFFENYQNTLGQRNTLGYKAALTPEQHDAYQRWKAGRYR
ncbi:MAG TPA: hypothetical protein VLJ21_03805 [Candidatus Binatia bacterium]|nr:hypothetical protein [Candidatus Binatia bacterium]